MNEPVIAVVPKPAPVKMLNINWEVIVVTNGDEKQVYMALSPGDYENLSLNMADILRWMRDASWQINYYRSEAQNGNVRRGNQTDSGNDSAGDSSPRGQGDTN